MVPRRRPQPRLEPLALPLPAGRVPLRGSPGRERPTREERPRVRAARHGCVRRRPVLDRRGPLREGRPDRSADVDPRHQRRARGGHAARAADALVPRHVVVGSRRPDTAARRDGRGLRRRPAPAVRRPRAGGRPGTGRHRTGPAVLRQRNQRSAPLRDLPDHLVPQGRDQRSRRLGRGDGEPRPAGHQVRRVVPGGGRAGGERGAAAAAASHRGGPGRRDRAGIRFRTGHDDPARPRPTSSTPSSPRPAPPPTKRW